MNTLIGVINQVLTGLFGLIAWPLWGVGAMAFLVVISFLSALMALMIFGRFSDQKAIRKVRNRIRGNMLAVRLYRDSVPVVLGLQVEIMRDTLTYMRYSLTSLPLLIVPFLLILVQLDLHLTARALQPGESAVVKVRFSETLQTGDRITLESPREITVETPPVKLSAQKEVSWRIRAQAPTRDVLTLHWGDEVIQKEVVVGHGGGAISSLRTGNMMEMLLHPGEAPIRGSQGVESIRINYPSRELSVWGWKVHWVILFFVLFFLFAFACKGFLGVEI